jgi:hypothetical protein
MQCLRWARHPGARPVEPVVVVLVGDAGLDADGDAGEGEGAVPGAAPEKDVVRGRRGLGASRASRSLSRLVRASILVLKWTMEVEGLLEGFVISRTRRGARERWCAVCWGMSILTCLSIVLDL